MCVCVCACVRVCVCACVCMHLGLLYPLITMQHQVLLKQKCRRQYTVCRHKFSKVPSTATLCSKCTTALIFENFSQGGAHGRNSAACLMVLPQLESLAMSTCVTNPLQVGQGRKKGRKKGRKEGQALQQRESRRQNLEEEEDFRFSLRE